MAYLRSGLASGGGGNIESYYINANGNLLLPDYGLFRNNTSFNEPVIVGDNVAYCANMFESTYFNSPLTLGNNIVNMGGCFNNDYYFNHPLNLPATLKAADRMLQGDSMFNSVVNFGGQINNGAYMFYTCRNLRTPQNINAVNCASMFNGCSNLNNAINFAEGCKVLASVFQDCYNFNVPVTFPESTNLLSSAFMGANNFNQPINIPNNVTDCYRMFRSAAKMSSPVNIGKNVTSCAEMFYNSNSPKEVYCRGTAITNVKGMFQSITGQDIKIYFNSALNSVFNKTDANSLIGASISWSGMTNGFRNTSYKINCYYNLPI